MNKIKKRLQKIAEDVNEVNIEVIVQQFNNYVINNSSGQFGDVIELMAEAAIKYYTLYGVKIDDYVTKSYITDNISNDYGDLFDQSEISGYFRTYMTQEHDVGNEFYDEFDKQYKNEIIKHIINNVDYIADQVNKGPEPPREPFRMP